MNEYKIHARDLFSPAEIRLENIDYTSIRRITQWRKCQSILTELIIDDDRHRNFMFILPKISDGQRSLLTLNGILHNRTDIFLHGNIINHSSLLFRFKIYHTSFIRQISHASINCEIVSRTSIVLEMTIHVVDRSHTNKTISTR
jgi:hypothetical protein